MGRFARGGRIGLAAKLISYAKPEDKIVAEKLTESRVIIGPVIKLPIKAEREALAAQAKTNIGEKGGSGIVKSAFFKRNRWSLGDGSGWIYYFIKLVAQAN